VAESAAGDGDRCCRQYAAQSRKRKEVPLRPPPPPAEKLFYEWQCYSFQVRTCVHAAARYLVIAFPSLHAFLAVIMGRRHAAGFHAGGRPAGEAGGKDVLCEEGSGRQAESGDMSSRGKIYSARKPPS